MTGPRSKSPSRRRGFTLVELLVVVTIVILVSAVALPTVLPALTSRQVSESARILQAALAGARDSAIRANAPRGIRLLPDTTLSTLKATGTGVLATGQQLTASRIVPIEPAPDLTDSSTAGSAAFVNISGTAGPTGFAAIWGNAGGTPPLFPFPAKTGGGGVYPFPSPVSSTFNVLLIAQAVNVNNNPNLGPNPPTNWFWNVRIGDKFRFHDSGRYYTIVGPMTISNPENFVNDGPADTNPFGPKVPSLAVFLGNGTATPTQINPEYLFLVNGVDDVSAGGSPPNGFIDDGFDGTDNDLDGAVDGISEWIEQETWLGSQALANNNAQFNSNPTPFLWTIVRRPVASPGAREVSLPGGATIDLTTWDTTAERSRLPVNPFNGSVDILLNQAGQFVPTNYYSSPSSFSMAGSFLHFWIADRTDVTSPVGTVYPSLPISSDAANQPAGFSSFLKKDRMLLTFFSRTGQVVTNSIESFDAADVNRPYTDAQLGIREAK